MRFVEVLLVEAPHQPGNLAKILTVIGDNNVTVEGLNAVRRLPTDTVWEITVEYNDPVQMDGIVSGIDAIEHFKLVGKSDRVFNRHRGGKIRMVSSHEIDSLEYLRDIYTPGVARVCQALVEDSSKAYEFTSLQNTVAIVTNGTAILGLGDIGPVAGLPVMEGKAAILNSLVGISGIPILINEKDPLEIVKVVEAISPSFGGILLEDIRSPECFQIEEELIQRIPKPVFHDDQHGTAMVVLAALLTAARHTGINVKKCSFAQIGLGAAGMGICHLLLDYGVSKMLGTDISKDAQKRLRALGGEPVSLKEAMQADVVVATTGVKDLIPAEWVKEGQIIMALSNPDAEIKPEVALAHGAAFCADGKTVNNMLAFPGLLRGALDARATSITQEMKIAVSETLARYSTEEALVPSPLNKTVHEAVAKAVREAVEGSRQ